MLLSAIEDKISACYAEGVTQFTDFLTLEEASDTQGVLRDLGLHYTFWGGYDEAQRRMLAVSLEKCEEGFPICVLRGTWDKFGEITHRDALGGLMASGIERKCVGDILFDTPNRCFYIFVVERMADYLTENVDRIGRCTIVWQRVTDIKTIPQNLCEQRKLPVSALRVDAVIAAVWNLSRQNAQDLIAAKRVYVDHSLVTKNTQLLRVENSVVVRGYGKFIFLDECGLSKKGKTYILIKQYL